jgi:acetoacetyl-CoA synthetase
MAADTGTTMLGTSPGYLMACREAGADPAGALHLPSLRTLGVTGSPLPDEGFDWATEQLGPHVRINSMSGGTDVCSGFVGGSPWLPAHRGELSGPWLGADVTAFDADGHEIVDRLGELVVRAPMPSMPIRLWNDPDGERYRSSYFDRYPGVWRHGDWVKMSPRRSFVITGRSDATLNRGGVRLGTAEFYAVVEELPEVTDSLVVHLEDAVGGPGRLLLFVALRPGLQLTGALQKRIRGTLRTQLSPRHVPDAVEQVRAVPRTLTGKKVETPIKQILRGRPPAEVLSLESIDDPAAVAEFAELSRVYRP